MNLQDLKKEISYRCEVRVYKKTLLVFDDGRVFSMRGKRFLKPRRVGSYLGYQIKAGKGKFKSEYIHRIVGKLFVRGYKRGLEINHKDGDKYNNSADNLEWVTSSQNKQHAQDTGLNLGRYSEKQKLAARKTGIGCRKLTMEQASKIVSDRYLSGMTGRQLAKMYNVSSSTISRIVNRKAYVYEA